MSTHSYKKNEEDGTPDKMTVFQDCLSGFNALPVSAKKCRALLSQLLRLLYTGETFPKAEATTLFFSISKLFQHKDSALRQLVYLAIKELSLVSEDVLMVTSSIMRDVQSNDLLFKPNAIRTLARVLDGTTVNAAERLMKTAVVDKNPIVASAALVSSYHLLPEARDVVKRWTNETAEAVSAQKALAPDQYALHEYYGSNPLSNTTFAYQYHALGLVYALRSHDRMLVMKMIHLLSGTSGVLKSPMAVVQLVRYIGKMAETAVESEIVLLLLGFLRHKSDMVVLEAARTVVALPVLAENFSLAVGALQGLLGAPRTVTRFAAVRALNRIAMKTPERIRVCNSDLEALVNDPNRSISTYAITTLLKTGSAENVDRLIKTIGKFISDISEEFQIVVIDAVRTLSLKFPEKHPAMLRFLNDLLRDDGGFNLKSALVEAMFDMVRFVPGARVAALEHLCEFIEDCEFTELSVRILHLLGNEGPQTDTPSVYVRHIYNRVVLENSVVRSAAVVALAKFGLGDAAPSANSHSDALRANVGILLKRCLNDADDEVRDRAAWGVRLLGLPVEEAREMVAPVGYSLGALEQMLVGYVSGGQEGCAQPFDMAAVPRTTLAEASAVEFQQKSGAVEVSAVEKSAAPSGAVAASLLHERYAAELAAIPELAAHGALLHSSAAAPLTEKGTEFVVTVVKHVFASHLVLQYNVENTLTDMELHDVTVVALPDNELYVEQFVMPLEVLAPEAQGTIYVSCTRPLETSPALLAAFGNTLVFVTKEIDPDTGASDPEDDGFQDEYQIEDVGMAPGDFIIPSFMASFTTVMDALPHHHSEVFNLGEHASLSVAVASVTARLSMLPLEGSDVVGEGNNHVLKLFGRTVWGGKVAVNVRMAFNATKGTLAKVEVAAEEEGVAELVLEGVTE